jgi:hypothetical protein
MFSPLLKGGLYEEGAQQGIFFDHGVISFAARPSRLATAIAIGLKTHITKQRNLSKPFLSTHTHRSAVMSHLASNLPSLLQE